MLEILKNRTYRHLFLAQVVALLHDVVELSNTATKATHTA